MHDVELSDEDCLRDFSDTARPTEIVAGVSGGGGGSSKTGYRTKFTQEQKEKMFGFRGGDRVEDMEGGGGGGGSGGAAVL
ncbi:hypothetical protein QJS10_CPA05g02099 [Acorus calamus]|uniref:Uncharacterized protein n=1 Tax=Acorus calamus TaxID=4465 RepID=A0AAV9EUN7_ACOCL|nr:hypothetical protein QJS10_CPA05g02099 [Acorus calamus]